MSIICNKTNTDEIKVFKNAEGFVFLLSQNELLAIDINAKKEAQLHFVGTLQQIDEKVLDMQVENWQSMIVVALRTATSLQIYVTKSDFRVEENLEPTEKIKINSESDRFAMFRSGEDLFLVTYGINGDTANELT